MTEQDNTEGKEEYKACFFPSCSCDRTPDCVPKELLSENSRLQERVKELENQLKEMVNFYENKSLLP